MSTSEERLMEAVIRVEGMGGDIADIKVTLRDMATAFTRLAVFDERQAQDRAEISRVFKALETLNTRVTALELAQPLQKQASDWVGKVVWTVFGTVLASALTFFITKPNPDTYARAPITAQKPDTRP